MEFSNLEKAVIAMILAGDHPSLEILRRQANDSEILKREFTGAGFYTTFHVPAHLQRLPKLQSTHIGDVSAQLPGLEYGAGFVLFVKDGALDFLEGFSYNEPWPPITDSFTLNYMGNSDRDWSRVLRQLEDQLEETGT